TRMSLCYHARNAMYVSVVCCSSAVPRDLRSFPTRRSSDLPPACKQQQRLRWGRDGDPVAASEDRVELAPRVDGIKVQAVHVDGRSEEHTSELQSREKLVCRLLLGKKKTETNAARLKHTIVP